MFGRSCDRWEVICLIQTDLLLPSRGLWGGPFSRQWGDSVRQREKGQSVPDMSLTIVTPWCEMCVRSRGLEAIKQAANRQRICFFSSKPALRESLASSLQFKDKQRLQETKTQAKACLSKLTPPQPLRRKPAGDQGKKEKNRSCCL